jgi:endonuclease/exonuclease/phosphatase (EEP) superfamily protein YafD
MRLRRLLLLLVLALLLVPAPLVTGARMLDPRGGTWVRLVAFTPYAGVFYLLALLALLPVAIRGHGLGRGAARVVAAALVIPLLVHAYWASGAFLGTPSAAASGTESVRVMTANLLKGRADASAVVRTAVARDVDVLVVEEVTPEELVALRSAGLRRVLPHRAGRAEQGTYGTMAFAKGRLRAVTRLDTGFAGYAMDLRLPDGPVHLLAVHPRAPLGDAEDWRADQLAVRRAARGAAGRTMIVGDLNATMDHAPMRELVGRGYQDAATQARSGWQPTWPSAGQVTRFGVPVPPLLAIDHVLLSDGLRSVDTETVTIPGTDHRALVVEVSS